MKTTLHKWIKGAGSVSGFFVISGLLLTAMVLGTVIPIEGWQPFRSWWFIALIGLLAVNTLACVGLRWRSIRVHSLVSHLGVLLIMAGSVVTMLWGFTGSLTLREGADQLPLVTASDGQSGIVLPFKVRLDEFRVDYHDAGRHLVRVTDREEGWSELLDVKPGGDYQLHGGKVRLAVKRYIPDFYVDLATKAIGERSKEPRNPALLVTLTASPPRDLWVFGNFPGMHQEESRILVDYSFEAPAVKQFTSRISVSGGSAAPLSAQLWVNQPLRHDGYTLYQSGYDPEDPKVSILQVSRDPGVSVVYAGFALLMLGLTMTFLSGRPRPDSVS